MSDVSARMFQFYLELASLHGVTADQLTQGLPEATSLRQHRRNRWYGWSEHVEVMRRFERLLGGPEAADAAMRQGAYRRVVRPFNAIVSFLTTARGVYWAGFRWFAPALFRCLRFRYEELGPNCVRGTVEIPQGAVDCPEFFRMWAIAMRSAPLNIGLPESEVEMELAPRRATYTIRLPQRRRIWPRIASWLRAVFHSADVVDELSRHQRELTEAYESLLSQHAASEAALRASEERQRVLLETLPDLIVLLGRDGRVRDVRGDRRHRLADVLCGLEGESLLRLEERLPPVSAGLSASLLDAARRAGAGEGAQVLEFAVAAAEGRRYFEWRTTALDTETVMCVVRDLSEKKRLEMQLLLADRLASLGTMAASVAHEINNPLACVMANLEFAQTQPLREGAGADSETARLALTEARDAAVRIRDIVKELRTLSRPDDPSMKGPVNLNALLESVLRVTSHQLRHRAQVLTEFGPVSWVDGNEGRLAQVFVNLLVNAAQAMPETNLERNRIRLVTRQDASHVFVEVHDNGSGIAPEVLPRIFDPFFTTKPMNEGTGLGLAICHRIVTDLGGTLEVESVPGRGSTFVVRLPRPLEAPAAERVETGEASPSLAPGPSRSALPRRVLVVDDNPHVALSVKLLLGNHDVTLASGGAEGVRHLLEREFDVVLCDLMMPDVDGMELYRRVREARPERAGRIVFMTGGVFTLEAQQFLGTIPNPCIEKPFRMHELEGLITGRQGP